MDPIEPLLGTPLTPELERELEREAEAGFDRTTLQRRHPGQPSLSGRDGRSSYEHDQCTDSTSQTLNPAVHSAAVGPAVHS